MKLWEKLELAAIYGWVGALAILFIDLHVPGMEPYAHPAVVFVVFVAAILTGAAFEEWFNDKS